MTRSKRLPEVICASLYACLLAFAIVHHEPWADEAQSWQLARSLTPWQLLHTYLHYEGSPGLWHLLLWALVHLGVSYNGMHWVCGAIAVAGIALLIFQAPFPRYLRLLLPFTYFFGFSFAVVARSYVLVPLLLFSTLALWKRNPILLAVLLGLMANLAAHATVAAIGVALLYVLDQRHKDGWSKTTLALAASILFAACAFALWTASPALDASYLPKAAACTVHMSFAMKMLVGIFYSPCMGFYDPWWLSFFFWIAIAVTMGAMGRLSYLAPIALFAIFSGAVHINFWLMAMLLLAILWILWKDLPTGKYGFLLKAVLFGSILTQIGWSAYAFEYDRKYDYSPDLRAARFLAPYIDRGDKIAATYLTHTDLQAFHAVGLEPYFHQHLFLNEDKPFWWWSTRNRSEALFLASLPQHPAIVVVEYYGNVRFDPARDLPGEKNSLLIANGYRLTQTFCATMPEKFSWRAQMCHLIYLHNDVLDPAPTTRPPG